MSATWFETELSYFWLHTYYIQKKGCLYVKYSNPRDAASAMDVLKRYPDPSLGFSVIRWASEGNYVFYSHSESDLLTMEWSYVVIKSGDADHLCVAR